MLDATPDTAPGRRRVVSVPAPWHGGDVLPSVPVTSYGALAVPAYYCAVKFLTDGMARFSRRVLKDGARRVPGDPEHPLDRLLRRWANECETAAVFWRALFFHAAHCGNAYARVRRGPGPHFRPVALDRWRPEDVCPVRWAGEDGITQQWYLHYPTRAVVPAADVVHLAFGLSYDGIAAMDPVRLHGETFERAGAIDRYQTRYLTRGTVIRGVVEIPTGVADEVLDQIEATIRQHFSGPNASREVLLLSHGASFKNLTISPKDSLLAEQQQETTRQIAQLTRVPPEFLFDLKDAKYIGIEAQGQHVVRYTFGPLAEIVEAELTAKLLSDADQDAGYGVRLNMDALLRGDTAAVTKNATELVTAGVAAENEGRELVGLPRRDDAGADVPRALGDTAPVSPIGSGKS